MAFEWNKIFILCGRKRLVILHKIQHSKFPAAGYRRTIRLTAGENEFLYTGHWINSYFSNVIDIGGFGRIYVPASN